MKRTVTLAYFPGPPKVFKIVKVLPANGKFPRVPVRPGDVIEFKVDKDTLEFFPGGRLRIEIVNAEGFDTGVRVADEDADSLEMSVATVDTSGKMKDLFATNNTDESTITTFKCQLRSADLQEVLADSDSGGEIVPDRG